MHLASKLVSFQSAAQSVAETLEATGTRTYTAKPPPKRNRKVRRATT